MASGGRGGGITGSHRRGRHAQSQQRSRVPPPSVTTIYTEGDSYLEDVHVEMDNIRIRRAYERVNTELQLVTASKQRLQELYDQKIDRSLAERRQIETPKFSQGTPVPAPGSRLLSHMQTPIPSQLPQFWQQQNNQEVESLRHEIFILKRRLQESEEKCARLEAANLNVPGYLYGAASSKQSAAGMNPLYGLSPGSDIVSPPMPIHSSTRYHVKPQSLPQSDLSSSIEPALQQEYEDEADDEKENATDTPEVFEETVQHRQSASSNSEHTYYDALAVNPEEGSEEDSDPAEDSPLDFHITVVAPNETLGWIDSTSPTEFVLVRLKMLRYGEHATTENGTSGKRVGRGRGRDVSAAIGQRRNEKYSYFVARIIATKLNATGESPELHKAYYYRKKNGDDGSFFFTPLENQTIYEVDADQIAIILPESTKRKRGEGVTFGGFNFMQFHMG